MEIAERIAHPDYEVARTLNDIALLKLKDPLDLAKHTPPCLHSWKKWEPGNLVPRLFFAKIQKFENKKLARKFGGPLVTTIKFGQQIQK